MDETIKSWLKPEHRAAVEAAETLKQYCRNRNACEGCDKCIFYYKNEYCLLMTDEFNDASDAGFEPTPDGWRLDLCE